MAAKKKTKITKKATAKKTKKAAPKAKKKTTKTAKTTKTKATAKRTMKTRKPNAAFMRPLTPSSILATVVGGSPLPRTEVTKKLWNYIKKNGLQDQTERRYINADDNLRAVFGGKGRVSMFEMTKYISKHLS